MMEKALLLNQISIVLYWVCFGLYSMYWFVGFTRWKIRFPVLLGIVILQIAVITIRGLSIGYFPLTNKFESFHAFATVTFMILLIFSKAESPIYRMTLFGIGYGFFVAAATFFKMGLSFAPPLMLTIWYALHVPDRKSVV